MRCASTGVRALFLPPHGRGHGGRAVSNSAGPGSIPGVRAMCKTYRLHRSTCVTVHAAMLDSKHPEEMTSVAWDGRRRRMVAHICEHCEKRFFAPTHANARFCSKGCAALSRRSPRVEILCATCGRSSRRMLGKLAGSRSGLYFCNRKCKETGQRIGGLAAIQPPHYGSAGYNRNFLIRVRGHRCEACAGTSWLGRPMPLEVHHIDGNRQNNADSNLQLLCCNCHSFTPNYRNRGCLTGQGQSLQD